MIKILSIMAIAFSLLSSSAWAMSEDETAAATAAKQYMALSYAGQYQESFKMVSETYFVAQKESTMAMLINADAEQVKKYLEIRGLPNDSLTSLSKMPAQDFYYKMLFFTPEADAIEKVRGAVIEIGDVKTMQDGNVNVELKITVQGEELPEKSVFNLTKENGAWKIVI